MGVVTLHVAGPVLDQGLALVGARGLGAAGQRVDLGDDRDLRPAGAVFSPQIGRHPGAAELDLEARRFQRVLEQLGAFDLLHAEFAEIEQRVAEQRHLRGVAIDGIERELLALVRVRGERQHRSGGKKNGNPAAAVISSASSSSIAHRKHRSRLRPARPIAPVLCVRAIVTGRGRRLSFVES